MQINSLSVWCQTRFAEIVGDVIAKGLHTEFFLALLKCLLPPRFAVPAVPLDNGGIIWICTDVIQLVKKPVIDKFLLLLVQVQDEVFIVLLSLVPCGRRPCSFPDVVRSELGTNIKKTCYRMRLQKYHILLSVNR